MEAGVIFTNPYPDAGTGQLTITVAAPVYDGTDTTLLLGVVGMDVDLSGIENSIKDLDVIGDEGYAYLLAPGGRGEVVVHKDLQTLDDAQFITELETGVDAEEFGAIVTKMSEECAGFETYSRDGSTWMLAWRHETVSNSGTGESDVCSSEGFTTVVAVSEAVLLEVSVRSHAMTGGGGAYSFVACLSHLTIGHASLSRRSTAPTPNRDTSNILGAHYVFSLCSKGTFCLSYPLPVSPSVATTYFLG